MLNRVRVKATTLSSIKSHAFFPPVDQLSKHLNEILSKCDREIENYNFSLRQALGRGKRIDSSFLQNLQSSIHETDELLLQSSWLNQVFKDFNSNQTNYKELMYSNTLELMNEKISHSVVDLDKIKRRIQSLLSSSSSSSPVLLSSDVAGALSSHLHTQLLDKSMLFESNVKKNRKKYKILLTKEEEVSFVPLWVLKICADNAKVDGHHQASTYKGPWVVTYDTASYFLQCSARRSVRERIFHDLNELSNIQSNLPVVENILQLRGEQARMSGYSCYTEMRLKEDIDQSIGAMDILLDTMIAISRPKVFDENKHTLQFAKYFGFPYQFFQPWDIPYWSMVKQKHIFNTGSHLTSPYFPLSKVLNGLFNLCESIFSISFIQNKNVEGLPWDKRIKVFDVIKDENVIGRLYLDDVKREGKKDTIWSSFSPISSSMITTSIFSLPYENKGVPSFSEEIFCTFSDIVHLSGALGSFINILYSSSSVSAPQITQMIMESLCYDKATLLSLSGHYLTNEPLPDYLFERFLQSNLYGGSLSLLQQAGQEKLEIDLHKSSHCSPLVICSQTEELCFVPSNEFEATNSNQRFSFLDNINMFGSNSKKPFGLWSNVLAADVVDHMLEERNKNGWKDVGGKYVNTLLSSPSSSAFQEFKGRNATVVPLLLSHGYRQPSYNINYYSLPMLYRRAMFMLYGLHGQWDER